MKYEKKIKGKLVKKNKKKLKSSWAYVPFLTSLTILSILVFIFIVFSLLEIPQEGIGKVGGGELATAGFLKNNIFGDFIFVFIIALAAIFTFFFLVILLIFWFSK